MKKYITDAIVLRNINYRDSNKIYTMLSRDFGKITALARGVRKISSRRAGNLDTLNVISVSISEDSKGFKSINEAKTMHSFKNIKNFLPLVTCALQMIELANIFIDSDQHIEGVYELIQKSLLKLDSLEETYFMYIPLTFAEFELSFMALVGYELTLDKCSICSRVLDDTWETYWFNMSSGGMFCPNCRTGSLEIPKDSALLLREINVGSSLSPTQVQSSYTKKSLDLIKHHVETIAENFYRRPKVEKMLYT